ncbi:primary-amine oxidase [Legionella sp. CNM-4043-24]|uniref:primary-amine oxidase n=1 Tax=Legionella sp. CNM-4043-24 TaxID=3421646 RepID=UPI00403AC5A9
MMSATSSEVTKLTEEDSVSSLSLSHPLDPLTSDEIKNACDLLKIKQKLNENYRFAIVMTHEPTQDEILNLNEKNVPDRAAFLCVFDSKTNDTFEAIISLTTQEVLSWKIIDVKKSPYGQPPILVDEFRKCERIVKADSAWRDAMKRRGLNDEQINKIQVDPFSAGHFGNEDEKGNRLVRATSFYRENIKDNAYARPIEGIVAVVDLINERVLKLIDDGRDTPIPAEIINYDSASWPDKRQGLTPLVITQPEGPGFTVNGWEVSWQNWKLRIGFTPREGLILHQVSYQDGDHVRPVIYRASITDMLVPYGDPGVSHNFKSAFDAGEYGLGKLAGPLKLGCDCKGLIHYFDVPAADDFGKPMEMPHVICMHEEDAGTLWKHNDSFRDGVNEMRRSRELVISFFPTVGNYDYGFYWRLGQDGSLRLEVKLTGIVQTAAIYPDTGYEWGSKLTHELAAPYHQHFFNVRLHMMVDGQYNSFSESEFTRVPMNPDTNPLGTAFGLTTQYFSREDEAIRNAKAKTHRTWNISNASTPNHIGYPTAYKLEIPQDPLLLADENSYVAKRGAFALNNVWVTPYVSSEKYASGDYPNQIEGGNGLPDYIRKKRNISNEPLVVWVTFGPTHAPRPEEFPVMPAATTSISLKPFGFFARNPAMDLPGERDEKSIKSNEQSSYCCSSSMQ